MPGHTQEIGKVASHGAIAISLREAQGEVLRVPKSCDIH